MAWQDQKVLFLFVVYFLAWLLAGNLCLLITGLTNSEILEHFAQKALSVFLLSGVTGGSLGFVPQRVLGASPLVQRRTLLKPISLSSPCWFTSWSSLRAPRLPSVGLKPRSPFIKQLHLLTGFSPRDRYSQSEQNHLKWDWFGHWLLSTSSFALQLCSFGAVN